MQSLPNNAATTLMYHQGYKEGSLDEVENAAKESKSSTQLLKAGWTVKRRVSRIRRRQKGALNATNTSNAQSTEKISPDISKRRVRRRLGVKNTASLEVGNRGVV